MREARKVGVVEVEDVPGGSRGDDAIRQAGAQAARRNRGGLLHAAGRAGEPVGERDAISGVGPGQGRESMLESMLGKALLTAFVLLAALVPTALAVPPGPYLTTGAADQITDTSARVVVYVSGNPQGTDLATQCWVDYGTTLAYGSRADIVCAGTSYATLTGLTPGTTYYYQLGASNPDGTGHSPTYKSFTTLGTAPPNGNPSPRRPVRRVWR